jgi:hypothetical protein
MVAGFDFEEMFAGQGEDRRQIGTVTKVRLINRKDALDSLARTLGMFTPEKKKAGETAKRVVMPAGTTKEEWAKMHAPGSMQ